MEPYRQNKGQQRFYLGTNCNVLCIDQLTGETVWQTALPASLGSRLVSLLLHKGLIYAACYGRVACLKESDGTSLWCSSAKRLGEPASLALDMDVPGGMIIAGGGGMVYAFSARTGERMWKNGLRGLNYHPVTLRVPGAVVAQPTTCWVPAGKTQMAAPLENEQYTAEGFEGGSADVETSPQETPSLAEIMKKRARGESDHE